MTTLSPIVLLALGAGAVAPEPPTFEVVATVDVADAPHGIGFSADGRQAYVACAGGHLVSVLDVDTHRPLAELIAGRVPLDVLPLPDGRLIMTEFEGETLRRLSADGLHLSLHQSLAPGPSLFSPPDRHGRRYLVCERADTVYEVDPAGRAGRSWPTAGRPFPADVTRDGILLFVPAHDASAVTVIDTLNGVRIRDVPVGDGPRGGALTGDDVSYVVACSDADELQFVNTASFEVVASLREDVGPRPFAVAMTGDGRFALVSNSGGETVSVLDVTQRRVTASLPVGRVPVVIRAHPAGELLYVSSEGDHTVTVIRYRPPPAAAGDRPTEVVVLGTIHGAHRTSERYGLDTLRRLVLAIEPDDVCVEIPPNRWEAAWTGFRETGEVAEPRVRLFPEYTDVLLPLAAQGSLRIVPCAGWTAEMSAFRAARLRELGRDPARAGQWAAHEQAMQRMEQALADMGGDDDPAVIHTDEYDWVIEQGYGGPYNEHFNDDLADGGWDNVNRKHYDLVAAHLDSVRGQGRRVLVTFGAAHKGRLLRELRRRDDVTVLDAAPFVQRARRDGTAAPPDAGRP